MSNVSPSPSIAVMNLREFFHDSVQQALRHQHVAVQDHTEHYVVNVLTTFARADALYEQTAEGPRLKPLAHMLAAAVDAPSTEQRAQALQRLGDVSLFLAGFFAQSFARKLVDVDYHIAMGGRAYGTLADQWQAKARGKVFAAIFAELSAKFQQLVDVLNDVAETAKPASDQDLLRLYEIWIKTGSPRARRLLSERGIAAVTSGGRA